MSRTNSAAALTPLNSENQPSRGHITTNFSDRFHPVAPRRYRVRPSFTNAPFPVADVSAGRVSCWSQVDDHRRAGSVVSAGRALVARRAPARRRHRNRPADC